MLEARSDIADRARDLGIDCVACTTRRGGVVRLIEDQERLWRELAEPIT